MPIPRLVSARRPSTPEDEADSLSQFQSEGFVHVQSKEFVRATPQSTVKSWPNEPSGGPAIVFGRVLAACSHPFAAWRLLSIPWRLLIVTAYVVAGYFIVLGVLLILEIA